jgi:hypothetical protein
MFIGKNTKFIHEKKKVKSNSKVVIQDISMLILIGDRQFYHEK